MRQLADASGNLVQSYTYAPFGELIAAQGTRSSALRYTGEQTDDDTGLVYLRARWPLRETAERGNISYRMRSAPSARSSMPVATSP